MGGCHFRWDYEKKWKIQISRISIFLFKKMRRSTFFQNKSKITSSPLIKRTSISVMVIIHKIFNEFFQNNLISAEIMKKRWKSQNWRILASFFKKVRISAVNLIFITNSRLSTKSQRKIDYFRKINPKIVCHDPQILSIFLTFRVAVISRENRPVPVEGGNMRRKWGIPGWCALKSQLFHSAFARNLFKNDYSVILNEL